MKNSDKTNAAWKNAEIPIVIGVSAHRNIRAEAEARIERQVGEVIDEIISLCPSSPIIMLTGLAAGGDQLCARVALERGVKLMVALPEDEADYLNEVDFPRGSLDEYIKLRNDANTAGVFVVPDTEKLEHSDSDRDYKFRQQAIYVATNSHFLLALWDGTDATEKRSECGTNATVGFALKQNYHQPNGMEFYPASDGAVVKIFSPRQNRAYGEKTDERILYLVPPAVGESADGKYYVVSEQMPTMLKDTLFRTDRYNGDYLDGIQKLKAPQERADWQYLMTEKEYECGSEKSRRIHDCQCVSSDLSGKNKQRNISMLMLLALFGMGLILAFMAYDEFTSASAAIGCLSMLGVLVAVFAVTYFMDRAGHGGGRGLGEIRFGVHTRFIEYRALSEALRIQYYLTLYGLDFNVCRYITWSHKSLMPWVRKALLVLSIGENRPVYETDEMRAYYESIAVPPEKRVVNNGRNDAKSIFENLMFTKWVGYSKYVADYNKNGQLGYHLKSMTEKTKNIKRRDAIKTVALIVTLLTYLGLFFCEILPVVDMDYTIVWLIKIRTVFKCALGVFAAVTFLISYYYDKQSLDQIQADSLNMISLYGIAVDRVNDIYKSFDKKAECDAAFRSLILELAREQLVENATWVAYNRGDNIELPI